MIQFVFIKPIMAVATLSILSFYGENYSENVPWWDYLSMAIYNLSYTVALYELVSVFLGGKSGPLGRIPFRKEVKLIVTITYRAGPVLQRHTSIPAPVLSASQVPVCKSLTCSVIVTNVSSCPGLSICPVNR